MNQPRCLSTLVALKREGLSKIAQQALAGGELRFPTTCAFDRAGIQQHSIDKMQHMSISGMQDKIQLRLHRGVLTPVENGGTHILKPIPSAQFQRVVDTPANEALTMLLAKKSGIETAAHGLLRIQGGEFAYITRRFDRTSKGKIHQEDFGSLAGKSAALGAQWKYDYSYEELGHLVVKHCSSTQNVQEFFRRVVFCFVIGNGDAHIRNFSIVRNAIGRVNLSPAYDLLCTTIHIPHETEMALDLLKDDLPLRFQTLGHYSQKDFLELASAIEFREALAIEIIQYFLDPSFLSMAIDHIQRSFLTPVGQDLYLQEVKKRLEKLGRN